VSSSPVYYTFGNHMHWVDMEPLWGYRALPDSARDMLSYCAASGARGNVNFDAAGYEKLAAEAPDALAELREAVAAGQIEVVGGSYGQPYGLFQGGESNVRQRVYGVRAIRRLLGVRTRTFWEEEFDFCPQLPQILAGVGIEYASLFFQWTWHTPVVPEEALAAIWWEGLDGSRLLAAPRTALCLHQWPEDVASLLAGTPVCDMPARGIQQWLELLPSPDWMCRSELLLPSLRALVELTGCEVRFVTLSEFLEAMREHAVPRRYTLDDVFHGVSLGKNGDDLRHASRAGEALLLAAESLAAVAGLFGRPYAGWDVYPLWELEEAWRHLMTAQHHDNDECEALCGHIGRLDYRLSRGLAEHVAERTLALLAERTAGSPGRRVAYNPLGWPRPVAWPSPDGDGAGLCSEVPALGYRVLVPAECVRVPPPEVEQDATSITLRRGPASVTVSRDQGVIMQISGPGFPEGCLRADVPLAQLSMRRDGRPEAFGQIEVALESAAPGPLIHMVRTGRDGAPIHVRVALAVERPAVDLSYTTTGLARPDGGVAAALQTPLAVTLPALTLVHDHPYGVSEIQAQGHYLRKYPTGDWMTSPQVYEEVLGPFTALQLLDLTDGERGLLYLHDGHQAFLRHSDVIEHILSLYDPWDEDYFVASVDLHVRLLPHERLDHAARWRLAQEFTRPALCGQAQGTGGDLPAIWGGFACEPDHVALTALYRESADAGAGFPNYAAGDLGLPYVLRLVELNGAACVAQVRTPGPVAAVFRTNLLGEGRAGEAALSMTPLADGRTHIALPLRPYEIATLYLDLIPGRKQTRRLDERRSVWAAAHRADSQFHYLAG
jgi:alpha-mannosidase